MSNDKTRQIGVSVRKIFEMLLAEPDGLPIDEISVRMRGEQPPEQNGSGRPKDADLKAFEQMTFGCVAPIKAGWLITERYQWRLSEEGRIAYARYQDPETFIIEAGKRSAKGWLSVHFPGSYRTAGRWKDRVTAEYKTARRIGGNGLLKQAFGKPTPWQQILPLQAPRRVAVEDPDLSSGVPIRDHVTSCGVTFSEGGHALYLSPEAAKRTGLYRLLSDYPENAGLKIVKSQGGLADNIYVNIVTKGDSQLQARLVHDHKHLTLVANLLHNEGLGPRLYDLLELQSGNNLWVAYVIEHISGGVPSMAQCTAGVEKLRALDQKGVLKALPPDGFDDEEFECPTCGNNALTDEHGAFRYIDFQNFFLADYESYLTAVAIEAAEKSHFGDKSILRGGRYLYQSVPGVSLPGKRGVSERIAVLNRLMESCGVSVKDRLVLDIGCNIGMMMAQYLKLGAGWCHGWDRAYVVPHTEKLLLSLGCTRFSTTGGDINIAQPVEENLPSFLRPRLENCVVSYLAVRGHLGWLDALARVPWSFMIYEGHEGELREDMESHFRELGRSIAFEVSAVADYSDGDSEQRTVAILKKKPA